MEELTNEVGAPAKTTAFIGLGSNVGVRDQMLEDAVRLLQRDGATAVVAMSRIRETDPVGYVNQPRFLNAVARVETTLSAHELLHRLLAIETALGRKRDIRWGPRTIDLDLLVYGNDVIEDADLSVPHPRIAERRFVLEPLADLAPDLEIPRLGRVTALLAANEPP